MSISDTSTVDFVSLDGANNVTLTISDHLDWSAVSEHLRLLQEKINTYCRYVETGQLYDDYPEARDRRAVIRVIFFTRPQSDADQFLSRAKEVLEHEGFSFVWQLYKDAE